jgi:hypothetical protein
MHKKKFKDDSTCIEDMMRECCAHDTRVDESMNHEAILAFSPIFFLVCLVMAA